MRWFALVLGLDGTLCIGIGIIEFLAFVVRPFVGLSVDGGPVGTTRNEGVVRCFALVLGLGRYSVRWDWYFELLAFVRLSIVVSVRHMYVPTSVCPYVGMFVRICTGTEYVRAYLLIK